MRSGWQLIGAAAVLGAFLALCVPLGLSVVDRAGQPIACGSGLTPNVAIAQHVDTLNRRLHVENGPGFVATNYAGDCAELIADRRSVSLAVGGIGAAILLATLVAPAVAGARRARAGAASYAPRSASITALKSLSALGPADPMNSA